MFPAATGSLESNRMRGGCHLHPEQACEIPGTFSVASKSIFWRPTMHYFAAHLRHNVQR